MAHTHKIKNPQKKKKHHHSPRFSVKNVAVAPHFCTVLDVVDGVRKIGETGHPEDPGVPAETVELSLLS